jgi:hypothetical protein
MGYGEDVDQVFFGELLYGEDVFAVKRRRTLVAKREVAVVG